MKISEIIRKGMTLSFEVFPPKNDMPTEPLKEALKQLKGFRPDFISCTYGAGGTNKGRSIEICESIKELNIECLTHYTCIGNTRQDIIEQLGEYRKLGIENALALRGDFPPGYTGTDGDFTHADGMIRFIKENISDLCVGAACYPEKHIQCDTFEEDLAHMKIKQNCGAEFFISQLCYDIDGYSRWLEKVRRIGITAPIIPGIMPVLLSNGVKRMTLSNGCSIPKELSAIIGKYGESPDDFKKAGKEYTVKLLYKYINAGVDGIHIYTLNKYEDVADILTMSGIRSKD